MRLSPDDCLARLGSSGHGVLSTIHPERGVDAVPVVFVVRDGNALVPIDTVKPKSTTRLQRLVNIEHDPRCVLLVEHYDDDWSQLWWVRVHATATVRDRAPDDPFHRFAAYAEPASVAAVIELAPTAMTGWSASR
jgi:PPOX class probable F420-dependent enzyme